MTTTFGTGELVQLAVKQGVKKILLGIGSSATNDAGMGMATALGWQFLDKNGEKIRPIGLNLDRVAHIIPPKNNPLKNIEVEVICDVQNPLYGKKGAAYTYARQKGADDMGILLLDAGLKYFSKQLKQTLGKDFAHIAGAGAAGGMGAGTMAFLGAKLRPGIELILETTQFEQQLTNIDYIFTGEGRIDKQTLNGKLIKGICSRAAKYHIPVIGLCGALTISPEQFKKIGLQAAFSIANRPMALEGAIKQTATLLEQTAFHITRLLILK